MYLKVRAIEEKGGKKEKKKQKGRERECELPFLASLSQMIPMVGVGSDRRLDRGPYPKDN